jgi:hypothetical protein
MKKIETIEDPAIKMDLFFTNKKGEQLQLSQVKEKKILSIKVNYLTNKSKEPQKGLKGILGFKKIKQSIKTIEFADKEGINVCINDSIGLMVIRLKDTESLKKISAGKGPDPNTLWKHNLPNGYFRAGFHIMNIRALDWE